MYLPAFSEADDAGPGGDSAASEGPRTHADRDRSPRERQPVDDREDREAADEPVVRQRQADHERTPSGAEAPGKESARGPDPEPQGPESGGDEPDRIRRERDAPQEVLADAGHAEAPGKESARGPDPEPQGPVRGGEDPARIRRERDAPLEVLPDAGHAQRPSGRLDLGQGDQQPNPIRPGPEGPRPDPGRRGHGARLPSGRFQGARGTRGGPAPSL